MIRLGTSDIASPSVAVPDVAPKEIEAVLPQAASSGETSPDASLIEESFRTLRANLLLRGKEDTRTVVITSALPGEGKSTIAANLACSLAALGKRILLIDADLRRAAAHRFFEIPNAKGLADVLEGTATAEQVWQETSQGPTVLTSGLTPPDPHRLFESDRFATLMREVRDRFDIVLIDSAPLLAVTDTTLMVPHVDTSVLVLRYGTVSENEAALALQRLRTAGGKVMGCVMTQVTQSDDSFHSYAADYVTDQGRSRSNRRKR